MPGKVLFLDLTNHSETALRLLKALNSETRLAILAYLGNRTVNVNDIAAALQIAPSSATTHIQILEKADLIRTEIIPATHGLQKLCARTYDDVHIRLERINANTHDAFTISMPVGQFYDFDVRPTCGLASATGLVGLLDTPASFYEPEHVQAQLVWFSAGHVTYRFPNHLPSGAHAVRLDLSAEICSEAPLHHLNWPSDITLWINQKEIGSWTSPADFGGERGLLTPDWWETKDSQYGLLKIWSVTEDGSYIDGVGISSVSIEDLQLSEKPFIEVRLGIKPDAIHSGGINIFGEKFGNYPQPIVLKVKFRQPRQHKTAT
ncbi:MarR family transcriptional regulator [Ktedonosporobacter rubrisoli]|uniref:MarR family transcriptional regulator n=1 Tax=Ktedonosporobacter rubrisoli TaxID=2509675 RepID=A0A4P6JXB1_KTERU|nr:helix-turn-helix domain-containing protein [Ktedonosporobacter rubrisoli]QBD80043.1 MarR family transcriptional regulator [Ktedonosporobacter rubrisoli]